VFVWLVAGTGLLVALVAVAMARRASRRLDALTQSYWDLRYEYTRLRSQVSRLDPDTPDAEPAAPPASSASVSFVPLSTIRKKDK
jgi:acyl carrier protein phosphodiesterase